MSKLRLPIDYKNMQLELLEALKEDELYKLQNDAKIRAVEQNVPTYEDFRQMVIICLEKYCYLYGMISSALKFLSGKCCSFKTFETLRH